MAFDSPLASLLTEVADERLARWRTELDERITSLQFEKRLVDQEYAKRSRRGSRSAAKRVKPSGETTREGQGRFSGIPRQAVFQVVREAGTPVTPNDVRVLFAAKAIETKIEPLRTALNRLVGDELLVKLGPSLFEVAPAHRGGHGENGRGDPLSRGAVAQVQGEAHDLAPDRV